VYSNTINSLLSLNRYILDANGRLSLLSPRDKVRALLDEAGIPNFIRVYNDRDHLKQSSEEIVRHTTSINVAALRGQQQEQETSEYEPEKPAQPPQTPEPQQPQESEDKFEPKPVGPQKEAAETQPGETTEKKKRTEETPETGEASPEASTERAQPDAAQVEKQEPDAFVIESGDASGPTPSPEKKEPASGGQEPTEAASSAPTPSSEPEEKEQVPSPEQKRRAAFDTSSTGRTPSMGTPSRREEFIIKEDRKGAGAPLVKTLVILLLILGVGAGVVYVFRTPVLTMVSTNFPAVRDALPGLFATIEPAAQTPEEPEAVADSAALDSIAAADDTTSAAMTDTKTTPQAQKPEASPRARSARQRSTPQTQKSPSQQRSTSRARSAREPQPSPSPQPSSQGTPAKSIAIYSQPDNATVTIDGVERGTTPFTWNDPNVYGQIKVTVSKDGYQEKSEYIEYLGKRVSHTFTLDAASQTQTTRTDEPSRSPQTTQASSTPQQTPATASQDAAAPPQRQQSEPEATEPEPAQESDAGEQRAPAQATGGKPATVFISSIPPGAEVYMDGEYVGKTNEDELDVTSGTHTMKFTKGRKTHTEQMTFQPGKNSARHVTF
jgi:hypothetical protein